MSITKMSLVNIVGRADLLDKALEICLNKIDFHPENASFLSKFVQSSRSSIEYNYADTLSKLVDLAEKNHIRLSFDDYEDYSDMFSDARVKKYVDQLFEQVGKVTAERLEHEQTVKQYDQAMTQLRHIIKSDIDFDELFSMEYIKLRFGRLPVDSYIKLSFYESAPFIFMPLDRDEEYYWGIYFAPKLKAKETDAIFSSLYFERMWLPEYFHGTPRETLKQVEKEMEEHTLLMKAADKKLKELLTREKPVLNKVYSKLKFQAETASLKKYIAVIEDDFHMIGYIPQNEEKKLRREFDAFKDIDLSVSPAEKDSRFTPPVQLKNQRLFKPFEMFVTMYGLPSYHDIDPTPFVGVTYILLFGMMFGDLGQGLLLSLIGWLMYKLKKMELGRILVRCGFSSAVFGTIFGSVFGFEHLLDPLYQKLFGLEDKPVEVLDPNTINTILLGAVGLGALLIVISIIINIVLGFKQKNYGRALFSNNGIAGLVFYGSVLTMAVCKMLFSVNIVNPVTILLLIVLPLVLIFFREPLGNLVSRKKAHEKAALGEFITESFFEMFEFLLSYVTNTMSFLRVGGFILSHAGMMLVVFTLSELSGSIGSPFVIIIGNLFVMGMEGLIVGIQALRLEFYEIFSRFFDGDGKAFEPVKVQYEMKD